MLQGTTERLWSPQPLPAPLLYQFHIIGREHAEVAVGTVATPPAFVDHLDVGDDVLWIKRDLSVISWNKTERGRGLKTKPIPARDTPCQARSPPARHPLA